MSCNDNTPTSTPSRHTETHSTQGERSLELPLHPSLTSHPTGVAARSSIGPETLVDLRDGIGLSLNSSGIDSDNQGLRPRGVASSRQSRETGSSWSGRAVTRSNTYSSGSGRPFLTPRSYSTPNKLVKRSFSQHGSSSDPSVSLGSKRHAFKRPATSHQRSATLSHQVSSKPSITLSDYNDGSPRTPRSWSGKPNDRKKHLFQVSKSKDSSRGFNARKSSRDQPAIFRICPNGSRPWLLLGTLVSRPELIVDESVELDSSEGTPLSSSSWTPSPGLRNRRSADFDTSSSRIKPSSRPRRSFSISGLLNDSPPRRLRRHQSHAHTKLKRETDQRISSAPVMIMQTSKLEEDRKSSTPRSIANNNVLAQSEFKERFPTPSKLPGGRLRHSTSRLSRHSVTPSDRHSSNPGSVSAPRVFSWADEAETDVNSDTVYDSMRTGTTRSSLAAARPGLETLFDKQSQEPHAATGQQQWLGNDNRSGNEIDSDMPASTMSHKQGKSSKRIPRIPSVTWNPNVEFADSGSFDEGQWDDWSDASSNPGSRTGKENVNDAVRTAAPSASHQSAAEQSTKDGQSKSNLFDWSEEPIVDKGSAFATPPRPRTVHGKKQPDSRATRSNGRRIPSGLHARSQSVPVFQELTGRRDDVVRKFGTWGVGSKGVTEDWDEDFDFGDPASEAPANPDPTDSRIDSGVSMPVPESIQRQQSNILTDIGLLREWGLQIEELKDLRMRAALLGLIEDPNCAKAFEEVDAMVELADQEADDDGLAGLRTPNSSPNFVDDGFEQTTSPASDSALQHRPSPRDLMRHAHKKSVSAKASPLAYASNSPLPYTRPRKDSEAVAKSVIEALQRSREPSGNRPGARSSPSRKVPFDTATLKHIVPHVKELTRKVKQILRDAEGLNTSSVIGQEASPPLTKAFIEPGDESPSAQRERRMRLSRTSSGSPPKTPKQSVEGDMVSRMKITDVK